MVIRSLEQWREVSDKLAAHNYKVFCMQFDWNEPDGFQARFHSPDRPERIHLETKLEEVQKAIVAFNSKRRNKS